MHPWSVQVWFKHDLRVEDNPGLLAAVGARSPIIPFFCLDPQLFAHLSLTPAGPEGNGNEQQVDKICGCLNRYWLSHKGSIYFPLWTIFHCEQLH
jgi:hypothetical protein